MEDNVYLCGWRRESGGITLFTRTGVRVRARGKTYPEAEERLLEAIADAGGALRAVLEFDPPLPRSAFEQRYGDPELYLVHGDEGLDSADRPQDFRAREVAAGAYFRKPLCRACKTPGGPRNERPLGVTHRMRGDGGYMRVSGVGRLFTFLYSGAFLKLLTRTERSRLEFAPVIVPGAARVLPHRVHYELQGPAGLPPVALKGAAPNGLHCKACGARDFWYGTEAIPLMHFIARADLPRRLPSVFTVNAGPGVGPSLCMTAARWRSLVGKPGARGLIGSPLGVVPDAEVVRRPKLERR